MTTLYELRIAPDHRYEWLPIRLKNGRKKQVGKKKSVIIASDKLAKGEEFTIMRYAQEGRMIVVETEAKKRKPRKKKVPAKIEAKAIEPVKVKPAAVEKVKVVPAEV